jgi:hypothetical protein
MDKNDEKEIECAVQQLSTCPVGAVGDSTAAQLSRFLNDDRPTDQWSELCDRAQRAVVDYVKLREQR